ncbi:MAG: glycosyltransferase, partial [Gemmatimonadota bacterium]|nr:glycosyltransferase [Gemmatimonadota bacterium]
MQSTKRRIAMYSHDTQGMGHMRRNLLIAQALGRASPDASILLLFGAREAAALELPPGTECLTLPSLYKDVDGEYRARAL